MQPTVSSVVLFTSPSRLADSDGKPRRNTRNEFKSTTNGTSRTLIKPLCPMITFNRGEYSRSSTNAPSGWYMTLNVRLMSQCRQSSPILNVAEAFTRAKPVHLLRVASPVSVGPPGRRTISPLHGGQSAGGVPARRSPGHTCRWLE